MTEHRRDARQPIGVGLVRRRLLDQGAGLPGRLGVRGNLERTKRKLLPLSRAQTNLQLPLTAMPRIEEVFADGSRLVQTENGSWLILETDLAACHILGLVSEGTAHYNAHAPPPPGIQALPRR